ncbi:aldehyde dehydrogenase (NADP(+)) [Acinetobacter gyllenbergii]|uniref:aldehyde dehydrogenase (NADP(+)) n=1 Tax=Acinetobacter gyllenbergii TaxID=134534 RepID=UPI0021D005DC|nr:aldehyde dehydrogenase (NADP(+)) [Acinetobacter gyllenbergii]MCU4580069.1 aldehyde dehydrogenase (NADP(+)) [Acinetobacter gyllenbergii]
MFNLSGQNFIAGQRSSTGEKAVFSYDATTGQRLPYKFAQATPAEVNQASQAAYVAHAVFKQTSPDERAHLLETIASEIDALDDQFISTVCQETALPEARIRGERGRTTGQLRLFAQVLRRGDYLGARIDQALPERQPLARPDLRQYKIGIGPVAVFGASNFPLAFSTAGGDTASALAAGCPVIVKAHSGHMATAEYIATAIITAIKKCNLPDGIFSMIYGQGVGEALVKHPLIKAVGFTGSLKGGRALCDLAAARPEPIPVFAEMSSINPMILLPEALRVRGDNIAAELSASIVLGCGQFCTNPGLILGIKSPEFSQFLVQLTEHMAQQPAQTMLNKGTLQSYQHGLDALLAHAKIQHLAGQIQQGNQAYPQLFKADASLLLEQDELLQEEVFGPTTIVIEVENAQQLNLALTGLRGQLTVSLIAEPQDLNDFSVLIPLLEEKAGRLLLNGYPTGVEVCDAMVHGGPYPATSDARGTSVGTLAIERYLRPVCYQNYPDHLLPPALQNANPLGILRLVNGTMTQAAL